MPIDSTSLVLPTAVEMILVSRKYARCVPNRYGSPYGSLRPGSRKAATFVLFDRSLSTAEVHELLRRSSHRVSRRTCADYRKAWRVARDTLKRREEYSRLHPLRRIRRTILPEAVSPAVPPERD